MRVFEYETLILEEILTELQKTKQELIDMYHRLSRMVDELEHPGEKENALSLLNRVTNQLKDEHNWTPPGGAKKEEPPRQRQQRTGGSQAHQRASRAYQKRDDDSFKIVFFGRFVDPTVGKKGSDKVWGWGVKGDYIYHFWGPTGKTPQVKRMDNMPFNRDASLKKQRDKEAKGYKKMSAAENAEWIKQVLRRDPKFV